MKLFADESVDRQIVARLREEGHGVGYVAETAPGSSDERVLDQANSEQAVLLTADKDFGELVFRQRQIAHGVILVRLAGVPPESKADIVALEIARHSSELVQAFSVISPTATRIRRPIP